MQVHEVKCNSTLKVPVNATNCDLTANVDDSHVGQMRLCDGFVDGLIFLDATKKIALCFFPRHILVG